MTALIPAILVTALGLLLLCGTAGLAAMLLGVRSSATVGTGGDGAPPPRRAGMAALIGWGLWVALGLLVLALTLRAAATGHAPWSNLHEFSVAFAATVVATHLVLARAYPISGLGPLVALLSAALVGFGISRDDTIQPLVPALQQPLLLTVHVGAAVAAYAVAAVAFVAAVAELLQRGTGGRVALLPPADLARVVTHRAVLVGFPILTIAIALGAVWANLAWRSYWSNDPKELAAAATWLVFGAYLHVAGRRDRLAALAPWLVVLGFIGVLFTYIGAGLFIVGEHSYGTG